MYSRQLNTATLLWRLEQYNHDQGLIFLHISTVAACSEMHAVYAKTLEH